jgi:dihydrofolate reductase
MAITANGIIARETGEEDFLSDLNWDFFVSFAEKAGCFVAGRKTYEAIQQWEEYTFDNVAAKMKIVVSRDSEKPLARGYTHALSPKDALNKAAKAGFKKIVLAGGAHMTSAFMTENLVDEIILTVEPYLLGKGIPLFTPSDFEARLKLQKVKKLGNKGLVQLYYKVLK